MINRIGAPTALHIDTNSALLDTRISNAHQSGNTVDLSLEERVRQRLKYVDMPRPDTVSKNVEQNEFRSLIEADNFEAEAIQSIFNIASKSTHLDLCHKLVDSSCDAISAAPESGGKVLRNTMKILLEKDMVLTGEHNFFNSLIARLHILATKNNISYDEADLAKSAESKITSTVLSENSSIIQQLQACAFKPDNKLPSDFSIVNFMTTFGETMRIVGKQRQDEFYATNPDNGEVLARLKRIAVYDPEIASENAGKSPYVWMEPQYTGLKGGARNYSALYHETQSENLPGVNHYGIYPRNQTGVEGIGLMDDADGSYLYAYHRPQERGIGRPVPIFATNVREWQDDPWSAGKRTTIPTIPARNYQGGKAAISVTAPLTPRTVSGMDYFHSQATGKHKAAGEGAQALLDEFHRKFPGTGFPKSVS